MPNNRKIDPAKTNPQQATRPVEKIESDYSSLQERQREMQVFFSFLQVDNQNFSPEQAFKSLNHYIRTYRRILYSTVSNIVYDITDDDDSGMQGSNPDRFGTLLSNIEKLVEYTDCDANIAAHKTAAGTNEEKRAIDETRKAVWKIWIHLIPMIYFRYYRSKIPSFDLFWKTRQSRTHQKLRLHKIEELL